MPDAFAELARSAKSSPVDAESLHAALCRHLRGEVRFDSGSRALYSMDASNYRQVPIGVVVPRDVEDVAATIALCREHAAPLLCRGGGTSLAGQTCNVAVILDFSKYLNKILDIDFEARRARVQPGVILDTLRNAAEKRHMTFAPDPATHDRCTIGGMIGNNSCGVHSVMGGKTDDNIEELDVLTYDGVRLRVGATSDGELEQIVREGGRRGEIYSGLKSLRDRHATLIRTKYPNIPRRVSGYNLNYLLPESGFNVARALVGSEGTCVTILEATCRLIDSPQFRTLAVVSYPDIYQCGDHVPEIMSYGPIGLEGFDDVLIDYTRRKRINGEGIALLPEGGGWLLVEFGGGNQEEADDKARRMVEGLSRSQPAPQVRLFIDKQQAKRVWEVRESALGATSHVSGEPISWEGWEDAAVPPEKLGVYLRAIRKLQAKFGYHSAMYGHFGHACVHMRINFDFETKEGVRKFREFMEEAADLCVSLGGSISGEHGDGQARAELLPKMFGPELIQAFREFKALWDPEWRMNPGKLVEPYRMDENLKVHPELKVWHPPTHFQFPDDHGSMAHATLRCVGVGKCRREEGGVMCPSHRVTHDEEHSTRGRAHLLWELMSGDVLKGDVPRSDAHDWREEAVKHSLDLCLSCKGCKSDCPVGVDVATYKAEFLSHYYEGRSRPLRDYAFGNVDVFARIASYAPGLANLFTQLPWASDAMKFLAGVPKERRIPAFATETFRAWFRRQLPQNQGAPQVILWADTFNNYFHPQTAQAAVEVLEAAGFEVLVPQATLCCGRPLYDFGMLDRAKRLLLETLDVLGPKIAAGIPVVGLEPSCVAVFRDELCNLFPDDDRARRLSQQTFLLSEFLEQRAPHFAVPPLSLKALVHGHCHHKTIMKMTDEEAVLRRIGLDFYAPAPGCCGMAGSFGFEEEKYQVSKDIGELELLPAVRAAAPETLIIANGFSCREQIAQGTNRHALHLAEVLQMALRQGRGEPAAVANPYPETRFVTLREAGIRRSMQRAARGLALIGVVGAAVSCFKRTT
jgi:FAD/FMN-containing dehydrogenase/Fe-S oxidoreductase